MAKQSNSWGTIFAALVQYMVFFYSAELVSGLFNNRALFCYWGSWSVYRMNEGKFDTSNMDPSLCTHFVYSFAGIDEEYRMKILDPWNDINQCNVGGLDNYRNAVRLREKNPDLKVLIAVGGWNAGSLVFSNMSSNATTRQSFIASAIKFILLHDFDGLDLDWEYPGSRDGRPEDKPNFSLLVKELRQAFDGVVREPGRGPLVLSAALPAVERYLQAGYEIWNITKYLDYINIMAYDFHTWADGDYLYHHTGLQKYTGDTGVNATKNVQWVVEYFLAQGAIPSKLVLGFPAYGRTLLKKYASRSNIYDPATGMGAPGPSTAEEGYMAYYEICQILMDSSFKTILDQVIQTPYSYNNTLWISYDDPNSVYVKADYIISKKLGGAMIWSVDNDDFRDICEGISPFPLISTVRALFLSSKRLA